MHRVVRERLEEYLGAVGTEGFRDLEAHLAQCAECRDKVSRMKGQALWIRGLRAPGELQPGSGFYARLMARVDAESRQSFWDLLLDPAFGKRLVYGMLTLLVVTGAYLSVTDPAEAVALSSPESVMASEAVPPALESDPERQRDRVLVQLTTHSE